MIKSFSYSKGFTLIEVAIVMFILAVLLTSAVMSVSGLRKTANISETRQKLNEIEQALYGYAASSNRLPCPTIPGIGGIANPDNPPTPNAACGNYIGFVPSTTLGLNGQVNCDGLLIDPWGRPYRYSIVDIDSGPDTNSDFIVFDGIRSEGMNNVSANLAGAGLLICHNLSANCNGIPASNVISNTAVAVIFSMGQPRTNSLRENQNAGQGNITGSASCGSKTYPLSTNNIYYSAKSVEKAGSEFDDIMVWISPNVLFNKMLDAGALP